MTDPVKNIKALEIRQDMIIADLGAGTGFYTIPLAKAVPYGKVYAVEIVRDMLSTLRNKVLEAKLNNVECLWGNVEKIEGTHIKDETVDIVIASNILFQVENKNKFIEEIKRILKSGGQCLIIDWSSSAPFLLNKTAIVSKEQVKTLFESLGFRYKQNFTPGEHHYGIIFTKSK